MGPCLLEKAFAKLWKSYAVTEGGYPAWGMVYLCGGQGEVWDNQFDGRWARSVTKWAGAADDQLDGPRDSSETMEQLNGEGDWKDDAVFWQALISYTAKNYCMCCSTDQPQPD